MFNYFFKKRKIKKYAKKLPHDLKSHYGRKPYYSRAEVDASIQRKRMGLGGAVVVTDNCYAYAMYCSPEEFKEIHENAGVYCDYSAMRSEVSEVVFGGTSDFSFSTLLDTAPAPGTSSFGGSDSGSFSDGGGSDGGGGAC